LILDVSLTASQAVLKADLFFYLQGAGLQRIDDHRYDFASLYLAGDFLTFETTSFL